MTFKQVFGGLLCLILTQFVYGQTLLQLTAGIQRRQILEAPITRAAVGDPKLLSVQVLSNTEVLLTPKNAGNTNFTLWTRDGAVREFAVIITPNGVVTENSMRASQLGGKTLVNGETASLADHARAMGLMTADNAVDSTEQTGGVQVQTDIKIVEISRTSLKEAGFFFGVNRPAFTFATGAAGSYQGVQNQNDAFTLLSSGGFLPSATAQSIVIGRARSQVLSVISALQSNGFAYTLAEPSLVSLSGQGATFLAGGEFPYPASNRNGDIQISFKEFGVRLQLTPTVIDQRRIMLKVAPEVSELDFSNGVSTAGVKVPGLRTRRADTSIQMAPGESFIISGLISGTTLSQIDKFPGLADLPILGAFFRSSHFSREDRELIMIVTPHLVDPISRTASLPDPAGDYRHYTPGFGDMLFGDPTDPGDKTPARSSQTVGFSR